MSKDYFSSNIGEKKLDFSPDFLLVRSVHKPSEDKSTWLEFYTLYMHLAPLSSYPSQQVYRITQRGNGLKMRSYMGDESAGQNAPDVLPDIYLRSGDKIQVEQQKVFLLSNKQPEIFGLARKVQRGIPTGKRFWTSIRPIFAEPEQKKYGRLPKWMSEAIKSGGYGEVICASSPITILAGDAVGFLAKDDTLNTDNTITTDWFSHIEVISNDSNMPAFINNPGNLVTGQQFIVVKQGQQLYQAEKEEGKYVFNPIKKSVITGPPGKIKVLETVPFYRDSRGTWYEINPHTWVHEDGVKIVNQNDLSELKFVALEQEPICNVKSSSTENWVNNAFRLLGSQLRLESSSALRNVGDGYSYLADKLDLNKDGKLSAAEIAIYQSPISQGLRHHNTDVDFLLRRLIVKHESEWYGNSDHPKWKGTLESLSDEHLSYAKQWLNAHEWMSKVPPFNKNESVWHFHPIEFLNVLGYSVCACNRDITIGEIEKIVISMKTENLEPYLRELNTGFNRFGIKTCRAKAHFLAQILHESGYFKFTREINGEKAFYHPWYGRGLIQVTLKSNYQDYGSYIGEDVISSDVARDKLTKLPHSILSAFWFYEVSKKLRIFYQDDDFIKITTVINGGLNGYNDRLSIFNKAVKALGAEHLNKKSKNGVFLFGDSSISQSKIYSLAWGMWHDPSSNRRGTVKDKEKALAGYKKTKELIVSSPFPKNTTHKKVYGIEYGDMLDYVNKRIEEMK
ncbi:glycoside hydrolase family 19 protein [Lonsdalea quercina]|uniref:glycoside hydrolase family 19 protein n=1 Tax=Lonsdalea quercina TaxID=71657 RepID=UPI003975F753